MITYQNITIIGTSHIAQESITQVEKTLKTKEYNIIALELDKQRFIGIQDQERKGIRLRDIKKVGFKGYLFSLIGAYAEKKLGESVGTKPGAEMLKAIEIAREKKIQIALIDQDVQITLQKISKAITGRVKWQFFKDILRGIFFRKKEMKRLGITNFDLRTVPESIVIEKMIQDVQTRYPSLYKVLIEERNEIMAKKLHHLMELYPEKQIVAIVGAGHKQEMIRIIKELQRVSKLTPVEQ